MRNLALLAALPLALTACDKKDAPAASAAAGAEKASAKATAPEPPPGPPTSPAPTFDGKAFLQRLEGTWVTGGSALGLQRAIDIHGAEATVVEGGRETKTHLAALAPCLVKIEERAADGSTASTMSVFAFDGERLHAGLGWVAVPDAGGWVACGFDGVYSLRGTECLKWTQDLFDATKWKPEPGKCVATADTFTVTEKAGDTVLAKAGAIYASEQLVAAKAIRHKDLASAKAALPK